MRQGQGDHRVHVHTIKYRFPALVPVEFEALEAKGIRLQLL